MGKFNEQHALRLETVLKNVSTQQSFILKQAKQANDTDAQVM